ncbi:hypothetical protein ACFBZI_08675 [Moraxella sp. ZJ142]|uniref:hypothetical protein n=1 Tax=Moraxella marmotae TaxID=3344520 RepID=UPI0035D4976F
MKTSQEYYNWLQKFEKRQTSDDTFTPPKIYDAVIDYVHEHLINLNGLQVVRPFFPDGDYTDLSQYGKNAIVIDNPPFSIMTKICRFYQEHQIRFFLFAPSLTNFSSSRTVAGLTHVIVGESITYDNGANVKTGFIHNLTPNIKVQTAPTLAWAICRLAPDKKQLTKHQYPSHVVNVARLEKLKHIDVKIPSDECVFINALDAQKEHNKTIFGGGFLISDKQAQALKAHDAQITTQVHAWQLSSRELDIFKEQP